MYLKGMYLDAVAEEAARLEQRMTEIIQAGRPIIKGTAITNLDEALSAQDVARVQQLITTVVPITVENYTLHDHIWLTHRLVRAMADSLQAGLVDKSMVEIVALVHDFGRFVTHRFGLTDLVGRILLRELGFRQDIIDLIPDDRLRLASTVEELTTPLEPERYLLSTMIIEVADLHAKRDATGQLRSWWDSIKSPLRTRGKGGYAYQPGSSWQPEAEASQRELAIQASGVTKLHRSVLRYIHFAMWLEQYGANLEEIRNQLIAAELEDPVKVVIFDIGGVVVQGGRTPTQEIAEFFGVEPEKIDLNMVDLIPMVQTGLMAEADMFVSLAERIGKSLPANTEDLLAKGVVYREPGEGVVELTQLFKKEGYTLVALSDTVPSQAEIRRQYGIYDLFDIVALSPETGVTKQGYSRVNKEDDPTIAFKIAALRAGMSPSACIFIDDKEKYVETAKQAGMRGVRYETKEGVDVLRQRILQSIQQRRSST